MIKYLSNLYELVIKNFDTPYNLNFWRSVFNNEDKGGKLEKRI
jgi:hypothetical protein